MCARYWLTQETDDEKLSALMRGMERKYPSEYKTGEIFPGDTAPAVIEQQGRLLPVPATFGFPGYGDKRLLINARSETAAEKKTFAESFQKRRIVLPATGFFEWAHDEQKTKYLFTVSSGNVFYLCGLYRIVEGRLRFVVLTRAANVSMIGIHDRMPVIVGEGDVRAYLTDLKSASRLVSGSAPVLLKKKCKEII